MSGKCCFPGKGIRSSKYEIVINIGDDAVQSSETVPNNSSSGTLPLRQKQQGDSIMDETVIICQELDTE